MVPTIWRQKRMCMTRWPFLVSVLLGLLSLSRLEPASSFGIVAPRSLSQANQNRLNRRNGLLSPAYGHRSFESALFAGSSGGLKRVPADVEGVPIPFIDISSEEESGSSSSSLRFIECYADSTCKVDGIDYTVAVPCDYAVALCYMGKNEQLIPIEVGRKDSALMDDIFPVAESIVADEFGEELVLQRTPQTLTLVGELEEDDEEDEEDEDESDEEEVEVLLSFEHRDQEYHLVRLLDPILLVGKPSQKDPDVRLLLTPSESDAVMPVLEGLFLEKFNADGFSDDTDDFSILE